MPKFRKKPVVIEAVQWIEDNLQDVLDFLSANGQYRVLSKTNAEQMRISTLEGIMTANKGDWIIKGVASEFYPCKSDIFEATYEPAEPPQEGG